MPDAWTQPADLNTRWTASEGARLPTFEGARNFRDLGGYPTEDGRQVRWGLLYRSGSLAGLTPADHARLVAMGVRGVCDLRSSMEQTAEPYDWCEPAGLFYWSRDYQTSFGELRVLMTSRLPTAEAARAAMFAGYRRLPYDQAPAYRELFSRLAGGEVPLVFNCSAGKDRAGTAAALILRALGVPRNIVVQDYALTNTVVDLQRVFSEGNRRSSMLAQQPPEVMSAILRADPEYIGVALDAIEATSGSFESYLHEELGVGPQHLGKIRDLLLNKTASHAMPRHAG